MTAAAATRSKAGGKPVRWRRIGVIDVGSNSVRLVVYDVRGRAMQPRFNEKVLAALGKNLGADSLQRWLTDGGWPTERVASSRGFRVLRVSRG